MNRLIGKIKHLGRFTAADWGLLWQAWWLLLFFDLSLRARSLRWLQEHISFAPRQSFSPVSQSEMIARVARLTGVAARHHLYPMTCLRRALAMQWLLARRGVTARLCFGARREAHFLSAIEAHAWLEAGGQPLEPLPAGLQPFAPFTTPGNVDG
jgi:hypothetical protein